MTSPLPESISMAQLDLSVEAIMDRLEAESREQQIRSRQPFDETASIWLIDTLPSRIRVMAHLPRKIWEGDQALTQYYREYPWLLRAVLGLIMVAGMCAILWVALY